MALKFDMGNASWARQMAYQQQQQTASTLGEDIGTAFGMGASAIAGKAKKRWGKDFAKAVAVGEDKYGNKITKEGMDWRDFRKLDRQGERDTKRKTKLTSKLKDSGIFDEAYDAVVNRSNKVGVTPKSKEKWKESLSLGQLEKFNDVRKGRKADKFGNVVKGVLGAGAATVAAPFALTGSALSNIFKKKDKRDPITSDPADLVSDATPEEQEEQTARGTEGVSSGEPTEINLPYDATGKAVTLGKTGNQLESDFYTHGYKQPAIQGMSNRQKTLDYINPLLNKNTNLGFPNAVGGPGLSTGTEEEMLRNRELMTGGTPSDDTYEDRVNSQVSSILAPGQTYQGNVTYNQNPDNMDILNIIDTIQGDEGVQSRKAFNDRADEMFQNTAFRNRLNESMQDESYGNYIPQQNKEDLGYDPMNPHSSYQQGSFVGPLADYGAYVYNAPNVEKYVKKPAREMYRSMYNTGADIYDAYDDTNVAGFWKNVIGNSNILGYNK